MLAIGCGRHAQHGGRGFVKAPAGIEARVVHGVRDAGAFAQLLARAAGAQRGGIGLGRDAGGGLEHAMEMEAAHAGLLGQRVQVGRLLRLERAAGPLDGGGVLGLRGGGSVHGVGLLGRARLRAGEMVPNARPPRTPLIADGWRQGRRDPGSGAAARRRPAWRAHWRPGRARQVFRHVLALVAFQVGAHEVRAEFGVELGREHVRADAEHLVRILVGPGQHGRARRRLQHGLRM